MTLRIEHTSKRILKKPRHCKQVKTLSPVVKVMTKRQDRSRSLSIHLHARQLQVKLKSQRSGPRMMITAMVARNQRKIRKVRIYKNKEKKGT